MLDHFLLKKESTTLESILPLLEDEILRKSSLLTKQP